MSDYISLEKDGFCTLIKEHDDHKAKHSLLKEATNIKTKFAIQLKHNNLNIKLNETRSNPIVDKEGSMARLRSESVIMAPQDQDLATRYCQKHILKQNAESRCRLCHRSEEHNSNHVIARCTKLLHHLNKNTDTIMLYVRN